jgi:hypothetical protein
MGRRLNDQERSELLAKAEIFLKSSLGGSQKIVSPSQIRSVFKQELDLYFALCAIARGKGTALQVKKRANDILFPVRVRIERAIIDSCFKHLQKTGDPTPLLGGAMFGASKKQGASVRFPLASCQPTTLCASACYAHDVLDAAPNSVIRGALNGAIGLWYSELSDLERADLMDKLIKEVKRAVRNALAELHDLPKGYKRPAYIRFAHVGDAAAYVDFANALASLVKEVSLGKVQSVVYTRHRQAIGFDPNLFVVNFTLDASSRDRERLIPPFARRVFSAFGGEVDQGSEINFLEHHRWHHSEPIGRGTVCPATRPEAKEHTCDAVRCHKCFVTPKK